MLSRAIKLTFTGGCHAGLSGLHISGAVIFHLCLEDFR